MYNIMIIVIKLYYILEKQKRVIGVAAMKISHLDLPSRKNSQCSCKECS